MGPLGRLSVSRQKLAKNAASLVGSRLVTLGSRVAYVVITARYLGPELYGLFAYAQSWYLLFLGFVGLGLPSLVVRAVGRDGAAARRLVGLATAAVYLSVALLTVLCGSIGFLAEQERYLAYAVGAFALALAGRALAYWSEVLFVAHESASTGLRISMWFRPLEPAAAGAVLLAGGGIVELALAHAGLWWVQGVYGMTLARRKLKIPAAKWDFGEMARMVWAGAPLFLTNLLVNFIHQGPILLHKWQGGLSLGALALLIQFIITGIVVPLAIMQSLLPSMTRNAATGSGRDVQAAMVVVATSILLGTACAVIAGPLGRAVILPVFGGQYLVVADFLWVAVIGLALASSAMSVNQLLVARGQFWRSAAAAVAGAVTLAVAMLVPAWTSSEAVLWIVLLAYAAWLLTGAALAHLLPIALQSLFSASVALAVFIWLGQGFAAAAAGLAILATGAHLMRLRRTVRQALRSDPTAAT